MGFPAGILVLWAPFTHPEARVSVGLTGGMHSGFRGWVQHTGGKTMTGTSLVLLECCRRIPDRTACSQGTVTFLHGSRGSHGRRRGG